MILNIPTVSHFITAGFSLSVGSQLKKKATWRFEPSTFWGNRVK